jgi:hypothetical protein
VASGVKRRARAFRPFEFFERRTPDPAAFTRVSTGKPSVFHSEDRGLSF